MLAHVLNELHLPCRGQRGGGQDVPHLLPTLSTSAPAAAQEGEAAQAEETRKERQRMSNSKLSRKGPEQGWVLTSQQLQLPSK